MRKYWIILLVVFLIPLEIYAHEKLDDGWHIVKNIYQNTNCPNVNVWAYYQNGVEKERHCNLIRVHRGWGEAPENSLESIKMLKNNGYKAFEIDVRFTKDNIPVLSHDKSINRIARNKDSVLSEIKNNVFIKDSTLKELSNYAFVMTRTGQKLDKYSNNPITTFEEVLAYSKENGLHMSIELKDGSESQVKSIVNLVRKYQMDNKVLWLSTDIQILKYIKKYDCDEYVRVVTTNSNNCTPNYTDYMKIKKYCGTDQERMDIHKLLDNEYSKAWLAGDKFDDVGYPNIINHNFPEYIDAYPNDKYKLNVIKSGLISINSSSLNVDTSKEVELLYSYNGDGIIKCSSSDKNAVTCNIDQSKKKVIVKRINNSSSNVVINVYATQGIKYSATDDYKIIVKGNINYIPGDVNGDEKVDIMDYIMVRKYILGMIKLSDDEQKRANANNDDKINSIDYIVIRKIIIDAARKKL